MNEAKRIDVSNKLMKMGSVLTKEGVACEDHNIAEVGTAMIMLSALILDDKDMFIFSEICAMFTAKKILDDMDRKNKPDKESLLKALLSEINPSTDEAPKEAPQDAPVKKTRKSRKKSTNGDKPSESE